MTYIIADNILSPLGETTEQNLSAVAAGVSALKTYPKLWDMPEPLCASLFTPQQHEHMAQECRHHRMGGATAPTAFESMALCSIRRALAQTTVNTSSPRVALILSTTKGNAGRLCEQHDETQTWLPGHSAAKIAAILGMASTPIVACNACISGVSALILGARLIESGAYDHAIVCGAECLGLFIASGFYSLKAMAATPCRPFDMERTGMNLGEAAATVVLSKDPQTGSMSDGDWHIVQGAVRNDACHISAPSKNGEGAYRTLTAVAEDVCADDIAIINAHGTATLFNDQMESVAITRAGLSAIPVNSYKGYFGHTLGAAGIMETILTMRAIDHHLILGTKNFEERGVSGNIRIAADNQPTDKQQLIKMISGFGGNNASLLLSKAKAVRPSHHSTLSGKVTHHVTITHGQVSVDGQPLPIEADADTPLLTAIYKRYIGDYPKFYKMDTLSQLGFVASELLLQAESGDDRPSPQDTDHRAVILFNRSSSWATDLKYAKTIGDRDNFFPSPSLFVYTLPNIVAGEIAIRHHYYGETSFFILPERDDEQMRRIVMASALDPSTTSIVTGWLDAERGGLLTADFKIIE